MKHKPNQKQIKAFENVINAFKEAQKTGLVFYGKQEYLVAYTKNAYEYFKKYDSERTFNSKHKIIPYLSDSVLIDTGSDDYSRYLSKDDEIKFT